MPAHIEALTPLPEEIANALPALIAYVDADQRFQFANRAYENWFGLSLDEIRGRHFRDVVSEDIYRRLEPYIQTALGGETARFEATVRNGAGGLRRIAAQYVPCRDAEGRVTGYYSVIVDRTDRDQNLRLETILDGIGDGFCTFDRMWRLTYCNQAAEQYLGIHRTVALGKTYREIAPAVIGTPLETVLEQIGAAQSRLDIESEHIAPGKVLAISAFPLKSSYALSFRDVTVRNAAIKRAREQEQRLELAMAASGLGDWSWDAATDVMTFSPRAASIFGIEPGPVMTWTALRDLLHEEDRQKAQSGVERAIADRSNYEVEYRVRRPQDGAWVWVLALGQAVYDSAGAATGMVGVVGDISRSKAGEAALRESEARFRAMAEAAPAPVWVTSAADAMEFVNKAFADFAAMQPSDILADGWSSLIHPEDLPDVTRQREAARATLQPYSFEARFLSGDGAAKIVQASSQPWFDAAGCFQGYVGLATDVTEVRRFQAHQQLLINELNHRVKNTLATVQSLAHQTLHDDRVTREARDQFTSRLLALSAAHNVLTRQSWDGAPMLEIVAEAIRPYEDPAHRRVTMKGPAVRLAPNIALALSMALHELATNAMKYGAFSTAAGRVFLNWEIDALGCRIAVEWREEGGPPVTAPARLGFGSRLLQQGLAIELGQAAAFDYAPTGLVCTFSVPIQSALSPDPIA